MNIEGQKDVCFFLIRVKRLYSLYFIDGSNPTQLSIILYGKAIKERKNSEISSFSQPGGHYHSYQTWKMGPKN